MKEQADMEKELIKWLKQLPGYQLENLYQAFKDDDGRLLEIVEGN